MYVASRQKGVTSTEAAKYLNLSQPAIARNTGILGEGEFRNHGKVVTGAGLIASNDDPYERRRKLYTLTIKGRKFVERLSQNIEGI